MFQVLRERFRCEECQKSPIPLDTLYRYQSKGTTYENNLKHICDDPCHTPLVLRNGDILRTSKCDLEQTKQQHHQYEIKVCKKGTCRKPTEPQAARIPDTRGDAAPEPTRLNDGARQPHLGFNMNSERLAGPSPEFYRAAQAGLKEHEDAIQSQLTILRTIIHTPKLWEITDRPADSPADHEKYTQIVDECMKQLEVRRTLLQHPKAKEHERMWWDSPCSPDVQTVRDVTKEAIPIMCGSKDEATKRYMDVKTHYTSTETGVVSRYLDFDDDCRVIMKNKGENYGVVLFQYA